MKTLIVLGLVLLTACGSKNPSGALVGNVDPNTTYFVGPSLAACQALEDQYRTQKTVQIQYGAAGDLRIPFGSAPVFVFPDHETTQPDGPYTISDSVPTTFCTFTISDGQVRAVTY